MSEEDFDVYTAREADELEPVVRALLDRQRFARGAERDFVLRQLEGLARRHGKDLVEGLIEYWTDGRG